MSRVEMRTLVCHATGAVRLVSTPKPVAGPGELLLELRACGVCGTDLMKIATPTVAKPVQIGHEVVATVAQVGAGAGPWQAGTRVALAHHAPDPASHYTRRGSAPLDPGFKRTNIDPGGFADFIRAPAELVAQTIQPVPDHVPDLRAVFMEPLACCLRALDRAPVQEGDSALIVGAGAVGLLFIPLLRDRSVAVLAADIREQPLVQAGQWGAQTILLGTESGPAVEEAKAISQGRGVDLVILTVVTAQTLALALDAVRDGGVILLFGAKPQSVISTDMWEIWRREINLISSYSSTPDLLPRAMAILAGGRWRFEELVSHALPLAQAEHAIQLALAGHALKAVVTRD